jgi:hypothetical protein
VDDQEIDAQQIAGADRLQQELTRPAKDDWVPGGHVPDVGEVGHGGAQPTVAERGAEPLDLLVAVARSGPRAGVRDEDLDAVGIADPGFLDGSFDASLPAPDVGAEDHT